MEKKPKCLSQTVWPTIVGTPLLNPLCSLPLQRQQFRVSPVMLKETGEQCPAGGSKLWPSLSLLAEAVSM